MNQNMSRYNNFIEAFLFFVFILLVGTGCYRYSNSMLFPIFSRVPPRAHFHNWQTFEIPLCDP